MTKKTAILAAVALLLMMLLFLDSGDGVDDAISIPVSSGLQKVERLVGVIKAKEAINTVYVDMAPLYAEQVAFMDTVFDTHEAPKDAVRTFVTKQATLYGIKVDYINVAEPLFVAEGVYWVLVDVKFVSFSSKAAINAWMGFADAGRGSSWQNFDFTALEDDKRLLLSGQLAVVYVKAVE